MRLSRRGFFFGMGAGGVLLAAWALSPRRFAPPLRPGPGEYAFDAWLKIGKDGVVSVAVPQLEMGQGITTLLPQVVAMELGADWRQVAVEPAPVSGAYANVVLAGEWAPLWLPLFPGLAQGSDSLLASRFAEGEVFTATADGTSLAAHEAAARAAAAGARAMLAMAAAARWGVGWEECEAQGGMILQGKNKASFGELVADAAGYSPPSPPVLRAEPPRERPGEFPPGAPLHFPRLDLPSKVDGSHAFAGDIRLPDMVFAAIRHGPIGEARLGHYDPHAAQGQQGPISVIPGPGWLAAVASNWWAAEQALVRIAPRFTSRGKPDSDRIDRALAAALKQDGDPVSAVGDAMALLSAKVDVVAEYTIAPALHASVETASATARIENGRCELWTASQAPQAARGAVAKALDFAVEDVTLYPLPAGGSFDARLEHDHAVEAALIARAMKRPVQLTWSRWQEHLAGRPRTPAAARLSAQVASDGSITAARIKVAMPATARASSAGGCSAGEARRPRSNYRMRAIRWRLPDWSRPMRSPTCWSSMCRCVRSCRPGGCAAIRTGSVHSWSKPSLTSSPRKCGTSRCLTGCSCFRRSRGSPPASSAPRRWPNGAGAAAAAGRVSPAGR